MRSRAKRWVLGVACLTVIGTTAAGVLVLRNEFSGSEAAEQVHEPTAGEVSWDFLLAIDRRDAKAAAVLTDDPEAARKTLGTVFKKLPDAKVATTRHEDEIVDGDRPVGFDVEWTLGEGKTWSYESSLDLTTQDGRWRVTWTPKLIHPKLGAGQHLALLNGAADKPAVLDEEGEPLLEWDESGTSVARLDKAPETLGVWQLSMPRGGGKRCSTARH